MEDNLYQAPASNLFGRDSLGEGEKITQVMLDELKGTRPWMRLFGILGLIAGGLTVLTGLGTLFSLISTGAGAFALTALVQIAIAACYLYPALLLLRCAQAIGKALSSGTARDFEAVLEKQRRFWRFLGIALVVSLALGIVMALIGVGIASRL
ncbi:MAG: DUF5362 family protein [Verrucomicrobiota bacterium]